MGPAAAYPLLREASALWRGPVLADLSDIAPVATAALGLEQLHREVTYLLIGCAVDAGVADAVLGLATEAHAADPLREPAVLLLMRALAATGQAPEALRTGREYRRLLARKPASTRRRRWPSWSVASQAARSALPPRHRHPAAWYPSGDRARALSDRATAAADAPTLRAFAGSRRRCSRRHAR